MKPDQMKPILDRVIVQQDAASDMTPGGLIIPETTRDTRHSRRATVVAVGPGRVLPTGARRPVDVNVGDRVVYHRDAGWDLYRPDIGERLMMLNEIDLLAVEEM